MRTYFLKINLIKSDIPKKIKIQNPKKFSGASDAPLKISKKNPAKKALGMPMFSEGPSKRLMKITTSKTSKKPSCHPKLKWIKKLV